MTSTNLCSAAKHNAAVACRDTPRPALDSGPTQRRSVASEDGGQLDKASVTSSADVFRASIQMAVEDWAKVTAESNVRSNWFGLCELLSSCVHHSLDSLQLSDMSVAPIAMSSA